MKYVYLTAGTLASLAALALCFVSAARYETLFLIILSLDLLAVFCLVKLLTKPPAWRVAPGLIGTVVLFTVLDIGLRALIGVRVLDILI